MKVGKYRFRIPSKNVEIFGDVYLYIHKDNLCSLSIRFNKVEVMKKLYGINLLVYYTDYSFYGLRSTLFSVFDYNTPLEYIYNKYPSLWDKSIDKLHNPKRKTMGILLRPLSFKKAVEILYNKYNTKKEKGIHLFIWDEKKLVNKYFTDKFIITKKSKRLLNALAL